MSAAKITTVGNSLGIVLSREVLAKLHAKKGDMLYILETPHGVELTPYDPNFANQMERAEKIMRRDRDILKKLAE